MRILKVFSPDATPGDWALWCILWACLGMTAGGLVVLVALAFGAPK